MRLIAGLDLESTGLAVESDRIIEIAILLYDLDTRQRKLSYVKRIQPGKPIAPDAQAVHGISIEQLAGCPTFDQVVDEVLKIMKVAPLFVAHNGYGFDFPMLAHEIMRAGREVPQFNLFDTIEATWATPDGKAPKLGELAFSLNVDYDPALAHVAEYDVDRMMQCLFKGMDKGFFRLPIAA